MSKEIIEKFYWHNPDDILSLTHGGKLPVAAIPPGIALLPEPAVTDQIVVTVRMRDAQGNVIGTMSELEVIHNSTVIDVYMTIVIPGRGSLFVYETKDYDNPVLHAPYAESVKTGQPWTGEIATVQTSGPAIGAKGLVLAATGEFEGMTGFQQQTGLFTEIGPKGSRISLCETFWLTPKS